MTEDSETALRPLPKHLESICVKVEKSLFKNKDLAVWHEFDGTFILFYGHCHWKVLAKELESRRYPVETLYEELFERNVFKRCRTT